MTNIADMAEHRLLAPKRPTPLPLAPATRIWEGMKVWEGVKGGLYFLVQTMDHFNTMFALLKQQKMVAVDTETSGLSWIRNHACGIVVGWGVEWNFYIPIAHTTNEKQLHIDDIRDQLREVFENPEVTKMFWNEKFDRHFLRKLGLNVLGPIHDGVPMLHLIDENRKKELKEVAKKDIDKNSDKWEKALHEWRKGEASRRKKAFGDLITDYLRTNRVQVETDLFPNGAIFSGLTKPQVTSRLKKHIREVILQNHPLSKCKKDDISYDQIPLDVIAPYACADVHYTWLITRSQLVEIGQHDALKNLYINEMKLSNDIYETEQIGIKVDVPYLRAIAPAMAAEVAGLQAEIFQEVGFEFSIDSNQQLIDALRRCGVRLTKLTKKGKDLLKTGHTPEDKHYSVDNETLENLASKYPFAEKIQRFRKLQKRLSTYVLAIPEKVDDKHYVHSSFNANVSTGRMSSRDINLQNIEGRDDAVRKAFTIPEEIGREGLDVDSSEWAYVFADYAGCELRLTAHHSKDPTMLDAYPWAGEEKDLHTITCAEVVMGRPLAEIIAIYNDEKHPEHSEVKWYRNISKRVNFGIIYGAEEGAIQRQVSTPKRPVSKEACKEYIDKYFEKYYGVREWIDLTTKALRRHGHLQNTFGRYRRLPDARSQEKWKAARAGRQGVNFLIQGDAADMFKTAVVRVNKILRQEGAKTKIVSFVHDEIQFYWHKDEFHLMGPIRHAMQDFPQFDVPIKVALSISKRDWASKKELKK